MHEFEFQGVKYRSAPLDGDVQLGILRRLLPAATAFGSNASNLVALLDAASKWRQEAGTPAEKAGDMFDLVERASVSVQGMAEQLARLSDDDVAYITNNCMNVTKRITKEGPAAVRTSQGVITNRDDKNVAVRLAIAWAVCRADLGATLSAFMNSVMPEHGGTVGDAGD